MIHEIIEACVTMAIIVIVAMILTAILLKFVFWLSEKL